MNAEPCIHIIVEVAEARKLLVQADHTPESCDPPALFASVSFLGQKADSRDKPAFTADPSSYTLGSTHSFKHACTDACIESLISEILNSFLILSLHRCDTGVTIATCKLSLEEFVTGIQTLKKSVSLERVVLPEENEPYQVTEDGQAYLQISVFKDEPVEEGLNEDIQESQFELKPYTLVPENEAAKAAVLQIEILGTENIPRTLIDVAAQLPEGVLSFSIAIGTPSEGNNAYTSLQIHQGRLAEQALSWSASKKFFLSTTSIRHLRAHLEDKKSLPVEIARYISHDSTGFVDPLFPAYHSRSSLELGHALLQPGETDITVLASHFTPVVPLNEAISSSLLDKPAENLNPKAKPIQLATDTSEEEDHAWSGTVVSIQLKLSKPLVRPWQPPARPSKSLADILPKRPTQDPPKSPTAENKFRIEVRRNFL